MKLGFCSISALDRSLAEAAEVAAGAGLDSLEVTARPPHLDPDAGITAARDAGAEVRAAGIDVIAYGSYLGHDGRVTAKHAQHEVAVAEALRTDLLRVWAQSIEDGHTDHMPTVLLMQAACDAARSAGVTVVIERHIGSFADTPERIEALLDAIDRPNVALNYQSLDFLPVAEIGNQPEDAARLIRHAKYFHLKNYQHPGGEGQLFPGASLRDGALDYRSILGAALAAGYAGPMSIEFVAADERPLVEKLAEDVAFLREILGPRKSP